MRNISFDALLKLAQQTGTEPVISLEAQWVAGSTIAYATKAIDGYAPAKILGISAIDDTVNVTGGTTTQQVTVTLDDIDGSIKAILDANDIHKRPVALFQWFEGLDISDRFMLFNGLVTTPIVWDEGARTVTIDIVSQIEAIEVGFSVEEGNFPNPPYSLIGVGWPMGFGTVLDGPALFIESPLQGILALGTGIADPIGYQIALQQAQMTLNDCPEVDQGLVETSGAGSDVGVVFEESYQKDPNCVLQNNLQIQLLEATYAQQQAYETATLTIYGGENFPQAVNLQISVNGAIFSGFFSGQTFYVTGRAPPPTQQVNWRGGYDKNTVYQRFDAVTYANSYFMAVTESIHNQPLLYTPGTQEIDSGAGGFITQTLTNVNSTYWSEITASGTLPTGFIWLAPGAAVYLASDVHRPYVVNIIPSTVQRVAAYRNIAAGRALVDVPAQYYTIESVDYGTFTATEIIMNVQLSTLLDPSAVVINPVTDPYVPGASAGWEDDLYVSYTSSVGPNPVDIMTWLIDTYTMFTVDADSFAYVKTKLTAYPNNFQMNDRKDVQQVLQDIAYQSRCALYIKDGVIFLKYLSEQPTPVDSIGMSDIVANTLKLTHTPTEDLITQYEATWLTDYQYASYGPDTMLLRRNVAPYNIQRYSYNFYALTDESLVRKTATYWLIIRSGIWRLVEFATPLHKLNLEVYDAVTLNIPALAPSAITGVIKQAQYNPDTNQIDFIIWTPLLSGTTTPYHFAWPADVAETDLFPLIIERELGLAGNFNSPNFNSAPPRGSRLANVGTQVQANFQGCVEWAGGPPCRSDFGDQFPSDTGDTAPTKQIPGCISIGNPGCGNGTGVGGNPNGPAVSAGCCSQVAQVSAQVAQQQAQINSVQKQVTANQQQANASGAAGGTSNDAGVQQALLKKLPKSTTGCQVPVQVTYITPTEVELQQPDPEGHIFSSQAGDSGRATTSTTDPVQTFTFNSLQAASSFVTSLKQQIQTKFDSWGETVGQSQPQDVNSLGWQGGTVTTPCQEPSGSKVPAMVAYNPGT